MSKSEPHNLLPPISVCKFVELLGTETTIDLLLHFGGSEVYIADNPCGNGEVERVIGRRNLQMLSGQFPDLKLRVPLANMWLAKCLYAQRLSVAAIARRLRVSDVTVRPLTEMVPIGNGAMAERSFIDWDKDDIEALGLFKVDILALGMLTCIAKGFDLLRAHYGDDFDLASVP